MSVYVEVRVFSYDAERDGPYVPGGGAGIDAIVLDFANLANATAVFEDCRKPLDLARERGAHTATERIKPGRQPADMIVSRRGPMPKDHAKRRAQLREDRIVVGSRGFDDTNVSRETPAPEDFTALA